MPRVKKQLSGKRSIIKSIIIVLKVKCTVFFFQGEFTFSLIVGRELCLIGCFGKQNIKQNTEILIKAMEEIGLLQIDSDMELEAFTRYQAFLCLCSID